MSRLVALLTALALTLSACGHEPEGHAVTAPVAPGTLPTAVTTATAPRARPVAAGRVLAAVSIPRLDVWSHPVVEGVEPEHLDRGMGHFPGTALPGEPGNVALAGHRWNGPLYDFERLRVGDRVVVEQDGAHWLYTIVTPVRRILPIDVWVIDPVPGSPRRPMLTLITCWPKDGNSHREYVRARLTGKVPS